MPCLLFGVRWLPTDVRCLLIVGYCSMPDVAVMYVLLVRCSLLVVNWCSSLVVFVVCCALFAVCCLTSLFVVAWWLL